MLASPDDPSARFMYRASVKGEPSLTLPRPDTDAWIDEHIAGGYRTPREEAARPVVGPVGVAPGAGIVEGDIADNTTTTIGQIGTAKLR